MKKGEGGVGLGGGGGGPTAAAAQKHKTLLQRLDRDVGTLVDNFGFLVSVARVNEPPVQNSQESFMMEMRAARMMRDIVQAADALLKLVSELKQTAVFCDSASLNNHADQRTDELNKVREDTNSILARTGEETSASLKDLDSSTSSIPPFVPDC